MAQATFSCPFGAIHLGPPMTILRLRSELTRDARPPEGGGSGTISVVSFFIAAPASESSRSLPAYPAAGCAAARFAVTDWMSVLSCRMM